jgi:hypothetical protein
MRARCRIDELPGDAHPVPRLADAALEHIANAQLSSYLLHVDRAAFVSEARIARDNKKPSHARQRSDDVLDHPVSEIVLIWIAAQVKERQDGDRGLVGKRERAQRRRSLGHF